MEATTVNRKFSSSLVQEIIDYIIDFLHLDKETLFGTSLVAKSWIHASQYHIFTQIVCHHISIPSTITFFNSHPHLSSFVKTVCVSGTHPETEDPPTSTLDTQDISNIISAFPSLHSIRLEFIRIRSAKEEELSQLELEYCAPLNIDGMMDQQKRLHLQSFQAFACTFIGTDLRHILCLFSSINTLDLVESRIIVDEDLDTVITPTFPILKPQIRTYSATPNSLPNTATLLQSSNFSKSLLGLELHCENLVFFALECVSLIKPAIFPRLEELKFNFCGEPLAFFGDDDRAEHHAKLMMLVVCHLLDGNRKLKSLTFSFPVPLRLKKESMDSNYLEEMDLSPIPDFLIIPLAAIPLILSFHLGLEAIIDGLRSNMLRPYNPPPLEMIGFKMKFSTIISSSSSRPTSYGGQELRQLGDPAMQYLKDSFEWQNIIDVLLKLETLRRINVTVQHYPEWASSPDNTESWRIQIREERRKVIEDKLKRPC
ncbi:hypothetical protein C8Q75DRAFT_801482 [Abortiporus biennis]|nr:hypothetical protein C8Q75DRAFT_801482 [Abortiporus biennis]